MKTRFRVTGHALDLGHPQEGMVTVDRLSGLFSVRPLRSRREYTLPLATVAGMVVAKVLKAERAEQRMHAPKRHRPLRRWA